MGEYIGASIQFGGKIKREDAQTLADLINAWDLCEDFDGPQAQQSNLGCTFGNWEINYGDLSDLTSFASDLGLHYLYWHDGGPEWDSATTKCVNGVTFEIIESQNGPSMTERDIRDLGSYEAVLNRFTMMGEPLPPLEIV